jgi:hypothetical protein
MLAILEDTNGHNGHIIHEKNPNCPQVSRKKKIEFSRLSFIEKRK